MPGVFITFEGVEGSGKSTQARILKQRLDKLGYSVLLTREPGAGSTGEKIREILLNTESGSLLGFTELCLLAADRAQHVHGLIQPAIRRGQIVICDRYADSSIAYQGYARALPLDLVHTMNHHATGGLMPCRTLLLDVDAELSLERSYKRLHQQDLFDKEGRFESESLAFHQRVRQGYLNIAEANPDRVVVLDGALDVTQLSEKIWDVVIECITEQRIHAPASAIGEGNNGIR